jgi:DNA-binding response OmpR family regulator
MTDVVLVVEADSTLRKMLVERFHLAGFAPIAVSTWTEAVDLVRRGGIPFELIFLGPTVPPDEGCSERAVMHIPIVVLPCDPWSAIDRFTSSKSGRDETRR